MFKFRCIFLVIAILIVPFSLSAQEDENAEKQKQLEAIAEEILLDAKSLRLPENRATVFAQVGSHLWQTDQERARKLFLDSINELIRAQNEAENDDDPNYKLQNLLYGQSPRTNILNSIAGRDAELALELQIKSRPASLIKMILMTSGNGKTSNKMVSNQHFAVQELNMEKQFKIMAAEQNPERAIELFRESLKSGVTYNSINFLNNLFKKSPDDANKLLQEVFDKLLRTNLSENAGYNDFNLMLNFLTQFGNDKTTETDTLKTSDSNIRSLADKISNHLLILKNSYYSNPTAFKIIERYFPGRIAQIKKKQSAQNTYNEENERYNELVKNNPTAEELLKEADNYTNYRSSLYTQAAQKYAQNGNISRAISVINSNFSDQEAKIYISSFYQNLAQQEISKGNFDAAENLIDQITQKQNRIYALISLSQSIYNKNPDENKSWAATILDKADSSIGNPTTTLNDISMKINIASAYIKFDSERTFQMIEPLVPFLNEYSRAQVVVSKFQDNGSMRNGEYLIEQTHNFAGTQYLGNILQQLQNEDLNRTIQLINGFERFETRLALKLQLVNQLHILPRGTHFSSSHMMKRSG